MNVFAKPPKTTAPMPKPPKGGKGGKGKGKGC